MSERDERVLHIFVTEFILDEERREREGRKGGKISLGYPKCLGSLLSLPALALGAA